MKTSVPAAAALIAALSAGAAGAATVHETVDYSGNWQSPTVVNDPSVTAITGTWGFQNDYDLLSLYLPTGAQAITLVFEAILDGLSPQQLDSFSGGGTVKYKTSAYQWSAWEGVQAAAFDLVKGRMDPFTVTINLGDDFGGFLNLGLYGTHPSPVRYNITSSAWAVAPVPLPAGLGLLLAALGTLGAGAALRRRKVASAAA